MAQQENNNEAIARSSETNMLSGKGKKLVVFTIVLLCFLILFLIGLIAEAYINQHPVFEFLQYAAFQPRRKILGSVSLSVMYIGVFFYLIVQCLILLYDYQWKNSSIALILVSCLLLLLSFIFMFISFDWQIEYAKYKYLSFVLMGIGVLGQFQKETIGKINNIKLHNWLEKTLKFPFYILLFLGLIINLAIL